MTTLTIVVGGETMSKKRCGAEKVKKEKRKRKRSEEVWVEADDVTVPSISEQQRNRNVHHDIQI